ncbi:TetR/AcrR family transcriptional regulator [Pimelobacter sp. 30-1]|uniref:TetR/AcrR family transcriptional regulator n=1 Tax=Pimelobacter sp. 30-1 TaxID=2004991 RepID=UPI001C040E06|nr:TetR/AcrR family transcriptional regulator [Pimelobacter sp. 30-1]MBU2696038.1 TetR family transcriptional regulator [Pimelobacter sp. 30-1]
MTQDTSGATEPAPKRRYAKRLPVEQRREHLLDAALRVLVRDGYERVSIEAIAREAEVTRPVVYGAYDGLEPLLHALLDRTQRRALASALRLMPDGGLDGALDVDEWIVAAAGGLIDVVQREPEVWRPVLGLTQNAPAVVRDRITSTRELIRGSIADALQAGLERRGGPYLDVDVLAHLVLVTAEHFGRLALDQPETYDRDRLVTSLEGLLSATRPAAD